MSQRNSAIKKEKSIRQKRSDALPPPPIDAIERALHSDQLTIEWLAGDGSDRCYYRIRAANLSNPCVLMQLSGEDAKAIQAGRYDWIEVQKDLEYAGIYTPKLIVAIPEHAALIIEDYGDDMLETVVQRFLLGDNMAIAEQLYDQALKLTAKLLTIEPHNDAVWQTRSFDAERLAWELRFFQKKYMDAVAKIKLTDAQQKQFDTDTLALSSAYGELSKYFVHRDFHSRNIMVRNGELALIDFQDARLGPAAYDLVSLCFDSYVPFQPDTRTKLLNAGIKAISQISPSLGSQVQDTWAGVLLQRQLKAIGSFGYLTKEKGRGDYLRYVAPAVATLDSQDIQDSRWPFLSGELIEILKNSAENLANE